MLTEAEIKVLLDALADMKCHADVLRLEQQALVDGILTPAIRQQIADIECEFMPKLSELAERTKEAEAQTRAAIIAYGKTVDGAHLQAVYCKGRVSWDTKALDGYAVAHPEMATFRTTGEPSVSIRKV